VRCFTYLASCSLWETKNGANRPRVRFVMTDIGLPCDVFQFFRVQESLTLTGSGRTPPLQLCSCPSGSCASIFYRCQALRLHSGSSARCAHFSFFLLKKDPFFGYCSSCPSHSSGMAKRVLSRNLRELFSAGSVPSEVLDATYESACKEVLDSVLPFTPELLRKVSPYMTDKQELVFFKSGLVHPQMPLLMGSYADTGGRKRTLLRSDLQSRGGSRITRHCTILNFASEGRSSAHPLGRRFLFYCTCAMGYGIRRRLARHARICS